MWNVVLEGVFSMIVNLYLRILYRPGVPVRYVQQVGVGGGDAVVLHLIITMAGVSTQGSTLDPPGSWPATPWTRRTPCPGACSAPAPRLGGHQDTSVRLSNSMEFLNVLFPSIFITNKIPSQRDDARVSKIAQLTKKCLIVSNVQSPHRSTWRESCQLSGIALANNFKCEQNCFVA